VAPAAANITVADSGNFYTATNVEAVLAEIPTREQTLWPWYGYDVLDRDLATGTTLVTLTKDKTAFRTFTAPQDMVVTGVQMASTGTVSAGLTLCRFFLGQIVPEYGETTFTEGRFMVLARTASDTTMFNVANTLYSRSFSSVGGWPTSVRLIKGQRYFVGYYISGTTAPTVVSAAAFMRPQVNTYSTTSPLIGGYPLGIEATTDIAPAWTSGNMGYDGTAASSWYGLNCDAASTKTRPYDAVVLADSYGNSYPGWCWLGNATSGSRLNFVRADGLSGQETAAIASQVTNTLALRPKVVIVHAGINDVANTKSAASIQTNLTSIYTNLVAGGAQVILCTIPPSTSMDAGELVTLAAVNTWIKALNVTGVTIADTGNALTTGDGVTQNGSLYTDGVHPNFAGCAAMAAVLAPKITTVVTSLGG
jgi:lysophospholipase L1-like esterase